MASSFEDLTTIHVAHAVSGDRDSRGWLIERFTPLLLAQVRFRLARHLDGVVDAEDVVQDVWLIALPRLADLVPRAGRMTPVLLAFLTSVVHNRYRSLIRRHVVGRPADEDDSAPAVEEQPSPQRALVSEVASREHGRRLLQAIEQLEPLDREVVILRGIEQAANQDVAQVLGMEPNTVAVRYRRALAKLRRQIPDSVLEDLAD